MIACFGYVDNEWANVPSPTSLATEVTSLGPTPHSKWLSDGVTAKGESFRERSMLDPVDRC